MDTADYGKAGLDRPNTMPVYHMALDGSECTRCVHNAGHKAACVTLGFTIKHTLLWKVDAADVCVKWLRNKQFQVVTKLRFA